MINQMLDDLDDLLPNLSVNCVIFRFNGEELMFPASRAVFSDALVIPGAFIRRHENIDEAAIRSLQEQIGQKDIMVSQFATFGLASRDFSQDFEAMEVGRLPKKIVDWISQRFVTIGYYSVVSEENTELKLLPPFYETSWIPVDQAGHLGMDHTELVKEALSTLRLELTSKPVLLSFLPNTFTIPHLQRLYEAILDRQVDRGNFRARILKAKILIKVGKATEGSSNRRPDLYKIDKEAYMVSLTEDIKLGF
ncbi:MAG: ADP-ribose pyrophosphatase YjhB (NUDIX family) [Neolewinella sp.]|jgi:8-oxo-dGTP diphosphatase